MYVVDQVTGFARVARATAEKDYKYLKNFATFLPSVMLMFELTLTKASTILAILAGIYALRTLIIRRFDYTKFDLQGKVAIVTGKQRHL